MGLEVKIFRHNPDNEPAKMEAYRLALEAMTDADLSRETKDKIWLSAYASNNPISCYHWQCDYTYNEWSRRGLTDRYQQAHDAVPRSLRKLLRLSRTVEPKK